MSELEIDIVAPGHGIVWRSRPNKIIDEYARYMTYDTDVDRDEVTIVYGSMYGMTEKAITYVIDLLSAYPVKVNVHRVPETDWGQVLASAWTSKAIIIGMPTYEYKMFPPMAAVLEELGKKKVRSRKAFRLGSYGWSGGAGNHLMKIVEDEKMAWDFVPEVEFKGSPKPDDYLRIDASIKELMLGIGIEQYKKVSHR